MKTTPTITAAILFLSFNLFGQDSIRKQKDISLGMGLIFNQYTRIPGRSYNLTYRHALNKKLLLKAGANADNFRGSYQSGGEAVYASDSVVILGRGSSNHNQFSGRLGFDCKLTKTLYAGAEVKLGYTRQNSSYVVNGYQLDTTNGTWRDCIDCVVDVYGEEVSYNEIDPSTTYTSGQLSRSTNHFFNYGVLLNMGVDVPVTDHFNLAFQGTFEAIFYNSSKPFSNARFPASINAMLRYRL